MGGWSLIGFSNKNVPHRIKQIKKPLESQPQSSQSHGNPKSLKGARNLYWVKTLTLFPRRTRNSEVSSWQYLAAGKYLLFSWLLRGNQVYPLPETTKKYISGENTKAKLHVDFTTREKWYQKINQAQESWCWVFYLKTNHNSSTGNFLMQEYL